MGEHLDIIPPVKSSLPSNNAAKPTKTLKISRKVRAAIEAMVWQGLNRNDAAETAGIKDNSLYIALRKPDVKAFYMRELDVLRTSERARDIHTLNDVRDQTSNQMARIAAVKAKWQIEDGEQASGGRSAALPGLQIVVIQSGGERIAPASHTTTGEQHQGLTIDVP